MGWGSAKKSWKSQRFLSFKGPQDVSVACFESLTTGNKFFFPTKRTIPLPWVEKIKDSSAMLLLEKSEINLDPLSLENIFLLHLYISLVMEL